MALTDNNYCLILAGGHGRRLWPWSREHYPKQFIDFFGTGRTQLQQTYDWASKFFDPTHIYVDTNTAYLDIVQKQLPEVPREHIIPEPILRNTAPSVAWGSYRILSENKDAVMMILPCDMLILGEDKFRANMLTSMSFAQTHQVFITMGVQPTRPEPGYGYIQSDGNIEGSIYRVRSFSEKPDREFAKVFMDSGEFMWNTGIFVSSAKNLRDMLSNILPPVLRKLEETYPQPTLEQEEQYMNDYFTSYPNISIETGILERLENEAVMKCDFGWADLGTWHSIYEALPKNNDDNVVIDSDVLMENSNHNVVKLPKDKIGVISGLDDFIVAEKDNVLLICKKEDSSALVRKYVNEVGLRKGDNYV